MKYVAVYPVEL